MLAIKFYLCVCRQMQLFNLFSAQSLGMTAYWAMSSVGGGGQSPPYGALPAYVLTTYISMATLSTDKHERLKDKKFIHRKIESLN